MEYSNCENCLAMGWLMGYDSNLKHGASDMFSRHKICPDCIERPEVRTTLSVLERKE